MKVIDLLNKIAKGEEVPKKITIGKGSYDFEWNGNMYLKRFRNKDGYYDFAKPDYIHILDEEIYIIEDTPKENKKIEKINREDVTLRSSIINEKIRNIDCYIFDKLDEIIDKLNGEDHE